MKRISITILTLILALSIFSIPSSAEKLSIDKEANILRQMSIVKGDGIDYNLEGYLTRGEAATLIVRLLGVEKDVLASNYYTSKFTDVKKEDWFAPYVSYCYREEIINGLGDGSFAPNDKLSEKALFNLLLKSMGYGNDYTWDEVYRMAFEKGLVDSIEYAVKTEDTLNYTRGETFSVIYRALNLPQKNGDKFYTHLLNKGAISPEMIDTIGWKKKEDALVTVISSSKLIDNSKIEVTLNEEIIPLVKSQVSVQEEGGASAATVNGIEYLNNQLTIYLEGVENNKKYNVILNNIEDTDGNRVESLIFSIGTLTEEIRETVAEDFAIEKILVVSDEIIIANFTEPLDTSTENPLFFDIYEDGKLLFQGSSKSLKVTKIPDDEYSLKLELLDDKFDENKTYELRIRDAFQSSYGSYISSTNGYKLFTMSTNDVEPLRIETIYNMGSNYIEITFNKDVDLETAKNPKNYEMKEPSTNRIIGQPNAIYTTTDKVNKYRRITVRYSQLPLDEEYELTIEDLKDRYHLSEMEKKTYGVIPDINSLYEVRVTSVDVIHNGLIRLTFDKPLSTSSKYASMTLNNFNAFMKKEVDETDSRYMNLYLSKAYLLKKDETYTLKIYSGLTSYDTRQKYGVLTYDFSGTSVTKPEIGVKSAKFLNDTAIKVEFNQKMSGTIQDKSKYKLKYKLYDFEAIISPESVMTYNDTTVIVKVPKVYQTGEYELEIKNMVDYTGQFTEELIEVDVERENDN